MNLLEQETCPTSDYRTIPLSRGMMAVVDAADYEWLSQWTWYANTTRKGGHFYALRKSSRKSGSKVIYMHRQILGIEGSRVYADHVNGDTLDNRRCNLRAATGIENSMNRGPNRNNTSGYKGVSRSLEWISEVRWKAQITINGKLKVLGTGLKTREEAAELYRRAAEEAFGEFARHKAFE